MTYNWHRRVEELPEDNMFVLAADYSNTMQIAFYIKDYKGQSGFIMFPKLGHHDRLSLENCLRIELIDQLIADGHKFMRDKDIHVWCSLAVIQPERLNPETPNL